MTERNGPAAEKAGGLWRAVALTAIGGVLGSVLGAGATLGVSQSQLHHEDTVRLQDQRRSVYARYLVAINKFQKDLSRAIAYGEIGELQSQRQSMTTVRQDYDAINVVTADVLTYASGHMLEYVNRLESAITKVVAAIPITDPKVGKVVDGNPDAADKALSELGGLVFFFPVQIRADLGLS